MVIAYDLVWTGYGWWLPNDPRGSGSRGVAHEGLRHLGEAHLGRREIQPPGSVVHEFYNRAEPELQHPLLRFDAVQIEIVGDAFSAAIRKFGYTCYACAILPDHVHILIRKHRDKAEAMIDNLQAKSALAFYDRGSIDVNHPVWTNGGWKGFLNSPERIRTTIQYIDRNPPKEHIPSQNWPFVTEYNNWPFHKKNRER